MGNWRKLMSGFSSYNRRITSWNTNPAMMMSQAHQGKSHRESGGQSVVRRESGIGICRET